ncbi:MAG: DUF2760 domain-containing protein [Desulfamplus sp.]|nr:DUF2760 domain-containing protein [Desulfamplus sp.]
MWGALNISLASLFAGAARKTHDTGEAALDSGDKKDKKKRGKISGSGEDLMAHGSSKYPGMDKNAREPGDQHLDQERGKIARDHADQRLEQERRHRLFLHFLSVLQREGRLLDFFAEKLDLYDDEQIGAAVRSIQEECKKTVEKYLAPVPVIDRDEGEMIDVPAGFDPDALKLTGNVSGEPPFRGILRHRGWKAGKKEIPRLSDVRDTTIIAPAEVEIE